MTVEKGTRYGRSSSTFIKHGCPLGTQEITDILMKHLFYRAGALLLACDDGVDLHLMTSFELARVEILEAVYFVSD